MNPINPKTGMTHGAMCDFIRRHFEEFVNRGNIDIGVFNFAPNFQDHGTDVPAGLSPGPEGAMRYVRHALERYPDLEVQIDDLIAEDDKVVVRNRWTATDQKIGQKLAFGGIVIWRIAAGQLAERWAYLEAPHPA